MPMVPFIGGYGVYRSKDVANRKVINFYPEVLNISDPKSKYTDY